MMLLYRLKKSCISYVVLFIVFFFCMTQHSIADDDLDQLTKEIQETLRSLGVPQSEEIKKNELHLFGAIQAFTEALESDDEETKDILKQWENYIIGVSHYSNADYANAINNQLTDYYKAIADLNNAIKKNNAKRKSEYSSSWVDDLVNHFGIEFVKQNRDVVLRCRRAIFYSDESFEYKLKDLIYIEAMLFGSYKDYFGKFQTFHNKKLDDSAQKKIEAHKHIAENFLALIDKVSFISMHNTTVLKKVLAKNKARQLNDEVFAFLKKHPLAYTFRDPRALKDFMKVIEK